MDRRRSLTYLVAFILSTAIFGWLCSCERLEIPPITEENTDTEEPTAPLPEIGGEEEEEATRNGSREHPYTVADVQELGKTYDIMDAWVEGYIVGWVNGTAYPSGARFNSESANSTNILLADSILENDPVHCIPVQLPATVVRKELNLQDNPHNRRRHIKLKGDITTYFKVIGLKKTSVFEWLGTSAMEDEKLALSVVEFNEDFSSYLPGTPLDTANTKKWHSTSTSYTTQWHVGSYPNERFATICHTDTFTNHRFDYWLITQPINLNKIKQAVLTFESMYENWDGSSELSLLILEEKEYNPEKILTYLQTPIACPDLISEGQWLPSGEITFESYSGVIYLAFRYRGVYKNKRCTSFSLDNIKLQEKDE